METQDHSLGPDATSVAPLRDETHAPDHGTRTILVTGATGFTGMALTNELVRRGEKVRALVRSLSSARALSKAGVELVEGDLTRAEDVERAAEGVSLIYHIGAVFRSAGHPDSYYHAVNAEGTAHVLEAARRHGVARTVHCSTVGVHGGVSELPSDESAPYRPGDIYQITKLAGEQYAQEAIARGEPVVIFRPTGIYGPGDLRFLKLFRSIDRGTFIMFGSGRPHYHFTYIDDLVEGMLLCGEHPDALGETFILGGDEYVQLNDLVKLIADVLAVRRPRWRLPLGPLLLAAKACERVCVPLGIDPPLHTRRCDFFIKERAFTSEKARRILGFDPKVGLAEGMQRTADWYVEQGLLAPRKPARHRGGAR